MVDNISRILVVLIRPIVSYSGSPFYYLNKYINNILKAFVKDDNNNAKNSATFSNTIRNVPIDDDEITVSFDITSFYTNIPNGKHNQGLC